MDAFVQENFSFIVFFHVVSAIVWVGGMIAVRVAVHPALQNIEEPKIRIARSLEITNRLFRLVLPFVVVLLLTAVAMQIGLGLKGPIVHVKEATWVLMALNYGAMIVRRNKAEKYFLSGHTEVAAQTLAVIPRMMIPVNIALGLFALYFGVILRGF